MKYRKLGNTGLIVSEVALGTMQFGGKMNMGNLGQEDTTRMVKLGSGQRNQLHRYRGRVQPRGERDAGG